MISNEYKVKLCLEHEVKRENKVVKKELIVAPRGEFYFVKFIINPHEDDVEPGVILGRSFLRMTKAITDLGARTDYLLDYNLDDVPLLGEEELSPFVCKMGKSSHNKKRVMENLDFFYQDIGTSSSAGGHLTQEEEAKEALAIRMSRKFALLKEEMPIIETMAYHDKYKKILDEIRDMISNEYKVKLCLEHEVKRENKVVKKELIVAPRGKFYFVKFIINPHEDDVDPGVILRRSFLRMTKAITDLGARTDYLLDYNLDDVPLFGEEELSPFVCKMGKSRHNKKRAMENLDFFYQDIGTSSSAGGHLTQEEAAKEALAIRMSQKFALLKEEMPIIETMAYHDKYKKILDEI
nr:hypothetical protein [Tanacetum cinerariifolium]